MLCLYEILGCCPAGGEPLSETISNRIHASIAYAITLGKGADAEQAGAQYFEDNVHGKYGAGGNRKRCMQKWGTRFLKTGSVHDAPRSGRPGCLPDETIFLLAKLLLLGYWIKAAGKRVWRGFTSLQQAAKNPRAHKLRDVLAQFPNAKLRSVQSRITQLVEWLPGTKRSVDFKMTQSKQTKLERKLVSGKHLGLIKKKGDGVLDAVVWIDAKKMFIAPGEVRVYNMNLEDVAEDVRMPPGKSHNGMSLHYYAGVNSLLGVVLFAWVTGTTGLRKHMVTQVCPASSHNVSAAMVLHHSRVTYCFVHLICAQWV